MGAEHGPITITVWSDYQIADTAELDAQITQAMQGREDVRYVFRHFPSDQSCNPRLTATKSPLGCRAAAAAEAAAIVGGNDAFWKMHRRLLAQRADLSDDKLKQAAAEIGFDPRRFEAGAQSPPRPKRCQRTIAAGGLVMQRGRHPRALQQQ